MMQTDFASIVLWMGLSGLVAGVVIRTMFGEQIFLGAGLMCLGAVVVPTWAYSQPGNAELVGSVAAFIVSSPTQIAVFATAEIIGYFFVRQTDKSCEKQEKKEEAGKKKS